MRNTGGTLMHEFQGVLDRIQSIKQVTHVQNISTRRASLGDKQGINFSFSSIRGAKFQIVKGDNKMDFTVHCDPNDTRVVVEKIRNIDS